jgi:hypothetical protein
LLHEERQRVEHGTFDRDRYGNSDGVQARIGSLGAGKEWFKPWRTITGREDAAVTLAEVHVMLEGVFERQRSRPSSASWCWR